MAGRSSLSKVRTLPLQTDTHAAAARKLRTAPTRHSSTVNPRASLPPCCPPAVPLHPLAVPVSVRAENDKDKLAEAIPDEADHVVHDADFARHRRYKQIARLLNNPKARWLRLRFVVCEAMPR